MHIVDYIRIFAAFNISYHIMKKVFVNPPVEFCTSIDCTDCPLLFDLSACADDRVLSSDIGEFSHYGTRH